MKIPFKGILIDATENQELILNIQGASVCLFNTLCSLWNFQLLMLKILFQFTLKKFS